MSLAQVGRLCILSTRFDLAVLSRCHSPTKHLFTFRFFCNQRHADGKVYTDMVFVSEFNFDCALFDYDGGDCAFPEEPDFATDCDGRELTSTDYFQVGNGHCDPGPGEHLLVLPFCFFSLFCALSTFVSLFSISSIVLIHITARWQNLHRHDFRLGAQLRL